MEEAGSPAVLRPSERDLCPQLIVQGSQDSLSVCNALEEFGWLCDERSPEADQVILNAGGPYDVINVPLDNGEFIAGDIERDRGDAWCAPVRFEPNGHDAALREGVVIRVERALSWMRPHDVVATSVIAAVA